MLANLATYSILIAFTLPSAFAGEVDYGYWDVKLSRWWAASGYRGWSVEAIYSGLPEVAKYSSWMHAPVDGKVTDTTKSDDGFVATLSGNDEGYSGLSTASCAKKPMLTSL
jgi:hypothetical protein